MGWTEIDEPNGSVQLVAPVRGSAAVPAPVPPVQVAPPESSSLSVLKRFAETTSPPDEWTVSTRLLIVSVSCASSTTFWIVYEHVYGSPIFVGLTQPFVSPMPCCTSFCPDAAVPRNAAAAAAITAAAMYRQRRPRVVVPLMSCPSRSCSGRRLCNSCAGGRIPPTSCGNPPCPRLAPVAASVR